MFSCVLCFVSEPIGPTQRMPGSKLQRVLILRRPDRPEARLARCTCWCPGCRAAARRRSRRRSPAALDLPLLARDSIKESLWDALGAGDLAWSRRLGAASRRDVLAARRRDAAPRCSTTSSTARSRTGSRRCPARSSRCTARARPSSRSSATQSRRRHPCHFDLSYGVDMFDQWSRTDSGPLALGGPLLEVDTTSRSTSTRSPPGSARPRSTGSRHSATATVAIVAEPAVSVGVAAGEEVEGVRRRSGAAPRGLRSRRSTSRAGCRSAPAPRVPATARDSMPKPRPPSSLARRIASTMPGASRSMHRARALGREVARAEAGAAGRDDEAGEAVGQLAQRLRRPLSTPSATTRCVDDRRSPPRSSRSTSASPLLSSRVPVGDAVGDGEHLGLAASSARSAARVADRARPRRRDRRRRRCRCPTRGCRRRPRPRACALSILMPPSISISTAKPARVDLARGRRAPCRAPRG